MPIPQMVEVEGSREKLLSYTDFYKNSYKHPCDTTQVKK